MYNKQRLPQQDKLYRLYSLIITVNNTNVSPVLLTRDDPLNWNVSALSGDSQGVKGLFTRNQTLIFKPLFLGLQGNK